MLTVPMRRTRRVFTAAAAAVLVVPLLTAAPASATSTARQQLRDLVRQKAYGSTSVAVYDYRTGTYFSEGRQSGQTTASIVKLQLLESLLLEHQRAHTALSSYEKSRVKRMIENSDNGAAEDVFELIGGRSAVLQLEPALGLNTRLHKLGPSDYWGLTTTGAGQEVTLLKNVLLHHSPLTDASRAYAVGLMRHVESDQRWGVPVVADKGTVAANKNGWLGVSSDGGRWAVNSIGIVTHHGHRLAIAVLTQHGSSFRSGVSRVQALVRAIAKAA